MKHLKLFFALFAMLALGVGNAWGAEQTVKWTATSGALGKGIGSGTIKTGTYAWNYTRTLISGASYTGWSSSCIQLGKNGGVENITFTTSAIPGTIKSVAVECSSYNNAHKVSIAVGGTTYLAATATAKWTDIGTQKGTGSSTGTINISFTGGARALYIKSITVVYEETSSGGTEPVLSSIEISGDLNKKTYEEGDELDLAGLTVNATYDASTKVVTNDVEWSYTPNPLTEGTTSVDITATYEDKTATKTINGLTVKEHVITPGEHGILLNNELWGVTAGQQAASVESMTGKSNDITFYTTKGSSQMYASATQTRFYNGATFVISVPNGYVIKSIVFTEPTSDKKWEGSITVDAGSYDDGTKSWSGSAQSVVFSMGAQNRIAKATVTYIKDVKYALTITEPTEGGTLVVKDGENVLTSGAEIYEGTKLTIIATPETGYEEGVVVVKNASDDDVTTTVYADGVLTMPAYAVTISATFEKKECTLLTTPTVSATTTYNSATLSWEAVENAAKYSVTVGETTTEVTEPTYTATGLNAETTYTYQVQAIAEAEQDTYCDSEVAEVSFTTAAAPVATLTLSDIEGTTTQTGALNGTITLPTEAAECSKTFVGWDADENCNRAPKYARGAKYTLAAETQTLYAVYADGESGEVVTQTLTITDQTTNSTYGNNSFTDNKGGVWSGQSNIPDATHFGLRQNDDNTHMASPVFPNNIINITAKIRNQSKSERKVYLCSNNTTAKPSSGDLGGVNVNGSVTDIEHTFTLNGTFNQFYIYTNGALQFNEIEVTYSSAPTYSNYSTTCAAAPIATVHPTSVTATAAGVNGTLEVSYENVNTENVAVALFNDEACTQTFTAGWLTADLDGDKNITYTVSATTLYTERKAYIQLTAPETTGATEPDVVVIPVTQAAKDKVFASLAELVAADLTAGDEVTVTLNNDVIKEFYIYSSKRCGVVFDVQKDGKDIKIYFNSQTTIDNWAVGGKLSGTLTNVKWTKYNSAWQLAPANTWAWANLTYTEPKAVSTVVVSGAPTKTTYVDGEAFDPAGLTVTVNYNDATSEVNPTGVTFAVTSTTLVKGQTSVSVTATYNSVTSAAYEVTGLTVNDIPTKTVAEFIAAGGKRCYLEGIVSDIDNTTYGNFNLTDASGTIYVYGCLNAAGESKKFAELGVKNGDKIKVIADQFKVFGGKNQATDVQYVSHKSAATITIADIIMEVGETKTIEPTITPAEAAVTYAIKAGSDNCITLNGAEITATEAGTATIVATIAETADYLGATKEFTVTVTTPDTRKKAVSPSPFTAVSGNMSPNDITFASYQGGAGTAPGIYNNGIRLYQISSGTYGGYITLTAVKGCMIDQVEITTTNEYETTTVAYSVDDNVTLLGSASVAKLSKYSTPIGLNTESVNILNLGTTKNNRLEIASITVYYTGQPLADPELSWTSNAVELRVGEAFTAPTLNNRYSVTGITYSSNNESLAKVNETTGAVTLVPDATGTATITATFDGNDTYKAVEVSYTITVKPALVYGVWELVTDVNSLAAGDKVVIVAKESDYALSTTQNSNNRGQAEVTKNNDNTVAFGNDVQVLTLEAGSVENTFALNTGNGYLYASSTSANQLKTQKTKDANASWKITITDGTASIVAQGTNTRNTMRYNQLSSLFACYGSASQQAICLYRKKNVKVEGETDNTSIPDQSDVTVDNAELTVTTEAEYDNMYIGNNGSVNVEEELTVNNLYIQTTMGTTTSGQLNTAPENLIVNGDAFIDITLGKNGDPSQWHAFTVPFPVDAMNGVYDLNDNQLKNEVNYAIMDYHGDIRANGQYGWKKYRGILVPGTFYLMTVDGARTTYRFKKVKGAELIAPAKKELKAYTGTGDATKDKGWNGVGNPTLMYGKVAVAAQILDPEKYIYKTITASSAYFTVGTPFFIQADADATVTIAAEVSGSLAPARRAAAAVENIKVMLSNSDYTDYLYVSASEDATNEYEIGKDLAKMTMTKTPSVPQIFAEAYNTSLCMIDAPMANNEAVVALNLYAPAEGEYTLSVEEQADATVYLLYNGNIVWNLSMSEYPIYLSQGDNAGYSLVVHRENAPTDVENILGADEQTEKFIYNGKLYILHEDKVFNTVGNMLK